MATLNKTSRESSAARKKKTDRVSSSYYQWVGKDRRGKVLKGEITAPGTAAATAQLRRQGVLVTSIRKQRRSAGRRIKTADITLFTRQLSTMMRAGIPLIQSFDIAAQGHPNPNVSRLLVSIRKDIESGSSMANAFRKHPIYFNSLYCNLIEAGEAAGILDELLDRLATYLEKTEDLKRKVRSALMYPAIILLAVVIVVSIMMIFVIPTFKEVFEGMGAKLPGATLFVMGISDFMVKYWYLALGIPAILIYAFIQSYKRNRSLQERVDRFMLSMPLFGSLVTKSVTARWTRTLATMFAAGIPLVDALNAVGGASGNAVYEKATDKIRQDVTAGVSLTAAMGNSNLFAPMVMQMTSIGEESGSLDGMLGHVADFYEAEVDEAVKGISSMIEPLVIILLGLVVGGILVAMYLPIFSLGDIV